MSESAELTEAKERADAAVELALQAQQRLKIREEVLTLQVVVQESLKKSIEDSREGLRVQVRELDRALGWVKAERDSEKKRAEGLFNTNCTLRQRITELEQESAEAVLREAREDALKIVEGSRMTECHIGPLFGAGWNGCIEHLLIKLAPQKNQ